MSDLVVIGDFNFRFQCQPGCTECCTQEGDVWMTGDDAERAAKLLDVTPEDFREAYCETAAGELRLTTPEDGHCHFLLEGACAIHQAKPVQCRTFPFWTENVKNKRTWKNLSRFCPGIGVGEILPIEHVRSQTQDCADAFRKIEEAAG